MAKVEASVTYLEYQTAYMSAPSGANSQRVLMKLFETKGIRLMSDSCEAIQPAQIIDDAQKQRFIVRQDQ